MKRHQPHLRRAAPILAALAALLPPPAVRAAGGAHLDADLDLAVCKELSLHAQIECAVYVKGAQTPAMSIDPRTVAEIAEFGASIDIDLYVLDEDPQDES